MDESIDGCVMNCWFSLPSYVVVLWSDLQIFEIPNFQRLLENQCQSNGRII